MSRQVVVVVHGGTVEKNADTLAVTATGNFSSTTFRNGFIAVLRHWFLTPAVRACGYTSSLSGTLLLGRRTYSGATFGL